MYWICLAETIALSIWVCAMKWREVNEKYGFYINYYAEGRN